MEISYARLELIYLKRRLISIPHVIKEFKPGVGNIKECRYFWKIKVEALPDKLQISSFSFVRAPSKIRPGQYLKNSFILIKKTSFFRRLTSISIPVLIVTVPPSPRVYSFTCMRLIKKDL